MKKFLSIILIIGMVLSFSGMTTMESVIADDEPETLVIEKPLYVTVLDDLGNPIPGTKVAVKDMNGNTLYSDYSRAHIPLSLKRFLMAISPT